jgi:hypothetical protein
LLVPTASLEASGVGRFCWCRPLRPKTGVGKRPEGSGVKLSALAPQLRSFALGPHF